MMGGTIDDGTPRLICINANAVLLSRAPDMPKFRRDVCFRTKTGRRAGSSISPGEGTGAYLREGEGL
jgi:hypothetical protein